MNEALITKSELEDIKRLCDYALGARTQKEAAQYIKQLESKSSSMIRNTKFMFSELIGAVKNAVGQVSDKDKRLCNAKELLIKFEMFCAQK